MHSESTDRAVEEQDGPPLPTYRAARVNSPEDIAQFATLTLERGIFNLVEEEIWWRDHYNILLKHGYRLRHRFRPGWKPSWLGKNVDPFHCEDALVHGKKNVIDAIRMKDGSVVAIKRVEPKSTEIEIGHMMSSPERLQEYTNHCAPVIDSFEDEEDNTAAFIVMPLYRKFNDPPFYYVEEVVDFVRQTLQGLLYLHSQRVAHRDLADKNIMMEGSSMFPKGFHPSWQNRSKDATAYYSRYINRADAKGVRYIFIDFGESTYFSNPTSSTLVTGGRALDHEVPELNSVGIPYDAFAVDVFTLGNVYKHHFTNIFKNLDFLVPLSESMTQFIPSDRPTAAQAFAMFEDLISDQKGVSLRWRLHPLDESTIRRISYDVRPFLREIWHFLKCNIVQSRFAVSLTFPIRLVWDSFRECSFRRSSPSLGSGEHLASSSDLEQ